MVLVNHFHHLMDVMPFWKMSSTITGLLLCCCFSLWTKHGLLCRILFVMFWLAQSCQVTDSLEPSHFTILAVTRKTPKTEDLTLISPYEIYSLNKERYVLLKHCHRQKWEGAVHMMMMMTWWYITPQENSGTQVKSSRSIQVMLVSNYMYFETWKRVCITEKRNARSIRTWRHCSR